MLNEKSLQITNTPPAQQEVRSPPKYCLLTILLRPHGQLGRGGPLAPPAPITAQYCQNGPITGQYCDSGPIQGEYVSTWTWLPPRRGRGCWGRGSPAGRWWCPGPRWSCGSGTSAETRSR